MAVTILYLSITSVKITRQGNFRVTHAFHNTTPGPLWAPWVLAGRALEGPLGPLSVAPLWASLGPCGPGRPYGRPSALMGRALVGPNGHLWVGP